MPKIKEHEGLPLVLKKDSIILSGVPEASAMFEDCLKAKS